MGTSVETRVRMPSATSVVARSHLDKIIGIENRLPWQLRTDLKHFKARTQGHTVIMGRKTFESIGKPLPNRTNIILSRSEILTDHPNVKWAGDIDSALDIADISCISSGQTEFFIVGGAQVYELFEPYINRVHLTEVFCGDMSGDATFDMDFASTSKGPNSEWIVKSEQDFEKSDIDDFPFRITQFDRRTPHYRYKSRDDFVGGIDGFDADFELYSSRAAGDSDANR